MNVDLAVQRIELGDCSCESHSINEEKSTRVDKAKDIRTSFMSMMFSLVGILYEDLPNLNSIVSHGNRNFHNVGYLVVDTVPSLTTLQLQDDCFDFVLAMRDVTGRINDIV